ncbi:hypothetical protein NPIL_27241 [Nephila pilipes]|uniref:Uncharacterized protein n=1 Tax=Nephila pilipes TaxID=299642 RepID=A0A8X6UDE0_NEPPI|nr:hypothetical protein NPIL_456081 [Nephila pilipes]GFT98908.1 hypothetical protein NPIL_27241 [Nephila pilipes]
MEIDVSARERGKRKRTILTLRFVGIILGDGKQVLRGYASSDVGDITIKGETSLDSETGTEALDSYDATHQEGSIFHPSPGKPRTSKTGKIDRPRKEFGQVSIITECFETNPSDQETLTGPDKIS